MKTGTRKQLSPGEKQATVLAAVRSRTSHDQRPWMKHFGWARDDADYEEAMKLGSEYRRKQNEG